MTLTLNPQTETLLQKQAGLRGQEAQDFADALLLDALEAAELDYEETCQAIAEGFADIDAGRTVSFEEARVWLEMRWAERVNLSKRTGIL